MLNILWLYKPFRTSVCYSKRGTETVVVVKSAHYGIISINNFVSEMTTRDFLSFTSISKIWLISCESHVNPRNHTLA